MKRLWAVMGVICLAGGCSYPETSSASFSQFVEAAEQRSKNKSQFPQDVAFGSGYQFIPADDYSPATGAVSLRLTSSAMGREPELLTRTYELRFFYDGQWKFMDGSSATTRSAAVVQDERPSWVEERTANFTTLQGRPDLWALFFGGR